MFWNLGQKNTTSSLEKKKTIWAKFITHATHLNDVGEGLGILLVFAKFQYGKICKCSKMH